MRPRDEDFRKWREDHPQEYLKRLARFRKWREENREAHNRKATESMARNRAADPEKYSAYMREYYQRLPQQRERRNARMREYYLTIDKAQKRERDRRWRANNLEKERIRSKNRQAWRRKAAGRYYPSDIQALYERQNGKCAICGHVFPETGTHRFEIDHIIPLKPQGATIPRGTNDPENLQLLCRPCNIKKGNRLP